MFFYNIFLLTSTYTWKKFRQSKYKDGLSIIFFNHRYIHWAPEAENTVILYGQIGSRKFAELHSALKAKASKGLIKYIVRHYLGAEPNTKKQNPQLRLSGYGVELQIKSSEYKAQDDRKVNADGQELNAEHNNAGLSNI